MNARAIITIVVIFIVWVGLDFLIHGVVLQDSYASTPSLWRPMEEAKMGLNMGVVFISASIFVILYAKFVASKSLTTGIWFGTIFGIGHGISFGYGSYSFMPIPYMMALVWFLGTVVQAVIAGAIAGAMIKE